MAESPEFFLLNDRYFSLETYVANKEEFDKPHTHIFQVSVLKDSIKKIIKDNPNFIREIYIECETCHFIKIFSLKIREKILKEKFDKIFDEKLKLAENSDEVTSWEYDAALSCTSVLCIVVGHKYERLENYVDKYDCEIFLDLEDDWTGFRQHSVMWHCLICHHRRIEVYPDNKKFLKNKKVF